MDRKVKAALIWCDHCNTEISVGAVRSCIRKTCKSKAKLPERQEMAAVHA